MNKPIKVREVIVKYGSIVATVDGEQEISPSRLVGRIRKRLIDEPSELFGVFMLNSRNIAMGWHVVSRGTLTASLVHPREVFRAAIIENAASVILVHNHPSGNAKPSNEDRSVTKRIAAAGRLLGVKVLDHVIVAESGYYSFTEEGEL
jgi:DNA repair protein RadC